MRQPGSSRSSEGSVGSESSGGFTLVEVLVAMVVATSLLGPIGYWFYKNRVNQYAYETFRCTQALERELHRAFVMGQDKSSTVQPDGLPGYTVRLDTRREGEEVRIVGSISKGKRPLGTLVLSHFGKTSGGNP